MGSDYKEEKKTPPCCKQCSQHSIIFSLLAYILTGILTALALSISLSLFFSISHVFVWAYKRPHPSILCAQTPHSYGFARAKQEQCITSYSRRDASVYVTESKYERNFVYNPYYFRTIPFFSITVFVLFATLHPSSKLNTESSEREKKMKNGSKKKPTTTTETKKTTTPKITLRILFHHEKHISVERRIQRFFLSIRRHLTRISKYA